MRKVELLPTRDCEAGYGPGKSNILPVKSENSDSHVEVLRSLVEATACRPTYKANETYFIC